MAVTDETILILTAGFGEGHNSAARAIAAALEQRSEGKVRPVIADLFDDAAPRTAWIYKKGYRFFINHAPALWRLFFKLTARDDFKRIWWDRYVGLQQALDRRLAKTGARRVVLTFPLPAYLLPLTEPDKSRRPELFMIVTDSITIHPVWLRTQVDHLFVTDEFSRELAAASPLCRQSPVVSGFPVSPVFGGFAEEGSLTVERPGSALKILYFACTSPAHIRASLTSLLRTAPENLELTVITGKLEKSLRPLVEQIAAAFPRVPVKILGWTQEIPSLMHRHDAVISKAGGATVHECLAAGVPVFLNYIVPGQEEGNAELVERLGGGMRISSAAETGPVLAAALADGRLAEMRQNMLRHRRTDGAFRIADAVLHLSNPDTE